MATEDKFKTKEGSQQIVQHRDKAGKDGYEDRRLTRGLSRTTDNIQIVNKARNTVLHEITEGKEKTPIPQLIDTPEFTFTIPDLSQFSEDFRAFLYKDIIEMSTLVSLEQAGRLNWWADIGACHRLLPLATSGDGNCLLHAASLGMWGFHDRMLTLRSALHMTLTNSHCPQTFLRRWKWHQIQMNQQLGLVFSEREWQMEWDNLTRLASTTPRSTQGSSSSCCDSPATKGHDCKQKDADKGSELFYESLEEFHVFVLAHILRRPIIVVADTMLKGTNGEALAPIPFGGIYLPVECDSSECHSSPLLLTYDAAHFSALVPLSSAPQEPPTENHGSDNNISAIDNHVPELQPVAAIPLVDPHLKLLPVHFLFDPGPDFDWNPDISNTEFLKSYELEFDNRLQLIKKYLVTEEVTVTSSIGISFFENLEAETHQRQRSHSWTGPKSPLKGEKSDKSTSRTLGRDVPSNMSRFKEPNKMSKQMHSMVKSFGSFGKSMGKKLKKNFGSITKAMKQLDADKKDGTGTKLGNPSSNEKIYKLTCASLLNKPLEYQGEMVANYLEAAKRRFELDQNNSKDKATNKTGLTNNVKNNASKSSDSGDNKTLPRDNSAGSGLAEFQRQDTLVNQGNSKFYTLASENHKHSLIRNDTSNTAGSGNKVIVNDTAPTADSQASELPKPVEFARSAFYDKPRSQQYKQNTSLKNS